MESWLLDHGYPALFLLSFLAATLLPVGSEWLLVALLLKGFDPLAGVALATTGNSLGAMTTYAVGLWGGPHLAQRFLRIGPVEQSRAEQWYRRYGSWSLLLSWLPVVGDPLCLVGGLLRVSWGRFLLLVSLGKLGRYITVTWATLELLAA